MIKRILIGVIFLMLIGLAILDNCVVNKSLDKLQTKIEALSSLIETEEINDDAKKLSIEIKEYWSKQEQYITIFVYYKDIDILGKQISLVNALLEENELKEAKIQVKELEYIVQNIIKVYEFSWDNIL